MSRFCVVSIDLQLDFFDSRLKVGKLEKALCLPGARRLIGQARATGLQVFHVVTVHEGPESMPLHLLKSEVPLYCQDNTEGVESIDGLVAGNDLRITKTKYSGFFDTALADQLEGYDSLILCGIATDCCVLHTALDAVSQGKHVYVPYQAVSATTCQAYVLGLEVIAKSAGAVVDLETVLTQQAKLWGGRLQAGGEGMKVAEEWYLAEKLKLDQFRKRSKLLPALQAREVVASLEAFLANLPEP